MHTPTYTYIHLHTPTYTYINLHTPTYTYINLHTPTYTYILSTKVSYINDLYLRQSSHKLQVNAEDPRRYRLPSSGV